MKPVKVYKMTCMFIDFDELGPRGAIRLLEDARYPNHIPGPDVMRLEIREVVWSDDHALNQGTTRDAAFEELFDAK